MMKKKSWILTALIILTAALAGCGVLGLEEEETEKPVPLDAADWPTPRPTTGQSQATPFPIVTLAPTATPTARPVAPPAATPAPVAAAAVETGPTSDLAPVVDQLTRLALEKLPPVAIGIVTTDGAALRQGPGGSFAVAGSLERGELAGILGQNPGGDWLYAINASLLRGWIPGSALRVTGSLENAPVLPNDPIGAAIAQSIPSASAGPETGGEPAAGSSGGSSVAVETLEAAATARVTSATLNVRQRPGASFKLLDTLAAGDEVTILALNRDRQWALVETGANQQGWVSIDFLDISGSLADAPQVRTLDPGPDHPPDQAAPVVALSGQAGPAIAASSSGSGSGANPVVPAGSQPALPGNTLAPVTTARVNVETDLRRGPAPSEGYLDSLTVDETVTVRAVNENRDWLLVQTFDSRVGWAQLEDLTVEGSLAEAAPVLTAWVDSNELDVRRGPGIYFDAIGTLAINDLVSVLGLNEGRSWVLVETLGGGQGWIPRRFLTVAGSLAAVPEISAPPLVREAPGIDLIPTPTENSISGKLVLQRSSGGDILLINADGSGLRPLTAGIDPALSPDGQSVAFTRWQGETGSLWLIGVDGANERSVLGFTKQAKGPAWSPDGSRIVLNFQQGGKLEARDECFNLASGRPPRPPRNAGRPNISRSDGKIFLCWTLPPDPFWQLRVVNLADGSFEDFDGGTYAFRPAWDPGQPWRVISDGGAGLVEVDVNRDTNISISDRVGDGSPVFSPDGRFLAVTAGNQSGGPGHEIHRLNGDGSGRVRLTQTPLWVTTGPDERPAWNNVSPAWSPDGSLIAFLTDRTGRWEVWVMNAADGANQRPLFSDAVNDQLQLTYEFVDERSISWQ